MDYEKQEKNANIIMAGFFIVVIMIVVIYHVFSGASNTEQEQAEPTATVEVTADVEIAE